MLFANISIAVENRIRLRFALVVFEKSAWVSLEKLLITTEVTATSPLRILRAIKAHLNREIFFWSIIEPEPSVPIGRKFLNAHIWIVITGIRTDFNICRILSGDAGAIPTFVCVFFDSCTIANHVAIYCSSQHVSRAEFCVLPVTRAPRVLDNCTHAFIEHRVIEVAPIPIWLLVVVPHVLTGLHSKTIIQFCWTVC